MNRQITILNRIAIIIALIAMIGCTSTPVQVTSVDEIEKRLAQAAADVAESVAKLAIVEQSARGVHAQAITPDQLPHALRLKVSMTYQGDLEPLVNQLAQTVGYRMQIYGRRKRTTPVHIIADAREVGLILADIDYQSSWRCDVFVIPQKRLIEVRYNRNRPKQRSSKRRR